MNKIPSISFISNSSQLSQSIKSSSSNSQSDLGKHKSSQSKRLNGLEDSRRRDQNKYQKKIQMYTQSIKERGLNNNIYESCSLATGSKKNSRIVSNTDLMIIKSNQQIQDNNFDFSKQNENLLGIDQNDEYYPTILASFGQKPTYIEYSKSSKKDEKQQNVEGQQSQISLHGLSSRNYTYRSNQSTHPNSGDQTNKYLSSKYLSVISPVKQLQNNKINNNLYEGEVEKYLLQINQDSFKNEIIEQSNYNKHQPIQTHYSDFQPSQNGTNLDYLNSMEPRQPIVKQDAYTECKTLPIQSQNDFIEVMSELTLSKIDCKESRGQSLKQSTVNHNSMSFNFNQPSVVYNDDIYSKKNSVNINNFLGQGSLPIEVGNSKVMHSSSQSNQSQEQKFLKSLIHKLHQMNSLQQQNSLNSDQIINSSLQNQSSLKEDPLPSKFLMSLEGNKNIQKNYENQYKAQTYDNQKPQILNPPQTFQETIFNPQVSQSLPSKTRSRNITPIKNSNKKFNYIQWKSQKSFDMFGDLFSKQPLKNTLFRNKSQRSITPIKKLNRKSKSQTNLHTTLLLSTQNGLKLNVDYTTQVFQQYEKDYNQVKQTEFSHIPPIAESTLSSIAKRKQQIQLPFNLPQNNGQQNNQNQHIESEQNTARLQSGLGWRCC